MNKINIKKLNEFATLPNGDNTENAGKDLYACLPEKNLVGIPPHTTVKIGTGVAMGIPQGYFGGVFARSGLSTKEGLRPCNCVGVIDNSYTGEIIVPLYNDSDEFRYIKHGQRIAQLIVIPFYSFEWNEVEELAKTNRGSNGFGSSGR